MSSLFSAYGMSLRRNRRGRTSGDNTCSDMANACATDAVSLAKSTGLSLDSPAILSVRVPYLLSNRGAHSARNTIETSRS